MLALLVVLAAAPGAQTLEVSLHTEGEAVRWVGTGDRLYLGGAVGPTVAVRSLFHDKLSIEASAGVRINVANLLLWPELRPASLGLIVPLGHASLGAGWRFAVDDDTTVTAGAAASANLSPERGIDTSGPRPSFGISPHVLLRWRIVESFWFELRATTPVDVWPTPNVHATVSAGVSWSSPRIRGTTRGEDAVILE